MTLPAFTIVTAGGGYFPLAENVQLGDANTVAKIMEGHIINFMKGLLP